MDLWVLLFLLIYSLPFTHAPFSWATRHTTVCLDKVFCPIGPKFGTYIRLWLPYTCAKFQLDRSMHSWIRVVCAKRRKNKTKNEEQNWNFAHWYLGNGWCDLLQFWKVASPYRQALPQQIRCSSDKGWRIYKCVKIATLLFLLIYSLPFVRPPFSWAARHTTVCLDLSNT